MPDQTDSLGGRLPLADPAALDPAQREIFDRMATRIIPWANDARFQSTAEGGRLIGPAGCWNVERIGLVGPRRGGAAVHA